ncbi:MAG: 6-carboxytetrahydropterin synthase [Gemmatimonadaceae bacterium]|nr:6-carboxytetrahydropterin synthase [Gemmatimonadaceae bacterium]
MPRLSLTRRVTFAAAHRYRRPEWSEERNLEVFGKCARAPFHGHTYTCDVSVAGPLDAVTGFVVDLALLDEILDREVMARFDHRNINADVAEFAEGRLVPSCENLAAFIAARVQDSLGARAQVVRVWLSEGPTLWAEWTAD